MAIVKPREDLTGRQFGRWTVKNFAYFNQGSRWLCRCICGKEKIVRRQALINRESQSCGCFNREMTTIKNTLPDGKSVFNRLYNSYKQAAIAKKRIFDLTREQFRSLTLQPCHYCGLPPTNTILSVGKQQSAYIYSGIDRKDNSIGYTADNCLPACKFCNQAKHTLSYNDFQNWLQRIAKHNENNPERQGTD